jgi:flagellar biosynthesis component FlhA
MCDPAIRRCVRNLTGSCFPHLAVLSTGEIASDVDVVHLGFVTLQ